MSNLIVVSGDAYLGDRRLIVTVTDPDGQSVDLTGTSLIFMVKRHFADADDDALIAKTTSAGIELANQSTLKGKAYIELAEEDTADLDGRYRWELQADDAIGVLTLAAGVLRVTPDLITTP